MHSVLTCGLALVLAGPLLAEEAKPLTAEQKEKLKEAARLQEQTIRLFGERKNAEGVAAWKKKVSLEKEVLGPIHDQVLASLDTLANLHEQLADYPAATRVRTEVMAALEGRLGKGHWRVTDARLALAHVQMQAGLKPEQQERLRRADRRGGEAVRLHGLGKFAEAVSLAEEAARLYREVLGDRHRLHATSLYNLATLHKELGDYAKALPLYQKARDIQKEALGEKHPSYAATLNNLATLYRDQGYYAKALPLFRKARDLRKEVLGDKHIDYANVLNNLASLYQDQGEYTRALPLFLQARDIAKEALGERHPSYANFLHNLASLYQARGDYSRALPLFLKAQGIYKEILGEKHPPCSRLYNSCTRPARAWPN